LLLRRRRLRRLDKRGKMNREKMKQRMKQRMKERTKERI